MPPKIKCAEYSYVKSAIWDLTEDEQRSMMTLPPSKKVLLNTSEPTMRTELLKCIPIGNLKEKNGKMVQRFRYLACVAIADGEGSIGIGEKIANSRTLAEAKAKEEALKNFRFVGKEPKNIVTAKCQDVTLSLTPAQPGSSCSGSPLVKKILEIIGITNCSVTGSDNTLSTVRAFDKALRKLN